HQVFKRSFVVCGANPAARLCGRAGGILGAFLVSEIMKDSGVWDEEIGAVPSSVTFFFLVMGVGCKLEVVFQDKTSFDWQGARTVRLIVGIFFFWGSWIINAYIALA
ncbi:hypothetical protein EDB87DRAFT_1557599, partial [Lactarius vividus]